MKTRIGTLGLLAFGLIAASPAGATDWSGPYVGGNVGYGWGKADTRFAGLPDPASFYMRTTTLKLKPKGFVAGPQLGYNWLSGRALYGLEGDVSWSDMDGTKKISPILRYDGTPAPTSRHTAVQDTKWFSTLRGRIGFVPSDAWLAYFTAGVAIADVKCSGDTDLRPGFNRHYPVSFSRTKLGWTVGIGTEWAIAEKWSAKAEYLYYDLGHASRKGPGDPLSAPYEVQYKWDTKAQIVRLGVNYHWGVKPAAVVPPPPPPAVEEVRAVEPPPPPPPPPAPVVKPVVVAPPPPPQKIVLDQAVLHFANSRNELSPEGVEAVQQVAEELQTYPGDYSLVVSGHTSSTGSKAYNKALSKRRADAVANVLVDSGIPVASIETVGMGPDQPIMDNATAEGQARNRRVEIEVKVKDAAVETRTIQTQTQDTPKVAPRKKKKAVVAP